jgi:hypothetical protein
MSLTNKKFQYPSVDSLKRLFAAADAFWMLTPWRWMGDREVVAVRDPASDRIAYCVVMGSAGMYFGMDAMLGDLGLASYRKMMSRVEESHEIDFLHAKNSLMLVFETQRQLTPEDLVICKAAGITDLPPHAWPQFRRLEPGFLPWMPEECDAVFLAVCLEQVVDVARRAKVNPEILGPLDQRTFLSRIPEKINGKIVWREEFISPESLERIIRITSKVDQALLEQALGKAKKTGMIWEADCFLGHTPIGRKDERPRFPFCYMLVDNHSGFVLHGNLVDDNDHGAGFLDQMCEAVRKNEVSPSVIHVRHSHLVPVFAPLATLGISTKVVKELPMLDYARKEMMKAFGPGGVMYTGKGLSRKQAKSAKGGKVVAKKQSARPGKNAVYQFKITLDNIRPAIWRRVQVKGDITLKRLAATILVAMGWTNSHLHQFHIGGKRIGMPYEDCDEFDDYEDEGDFLLCDFLPEEIRRFIFEYDFGDGWKHAILLEKVLEPQKGVKYPVCLDGARCCPPEDCGGPWGYGGFLEAISDPKHSEHDSMVEWSGGDFDPERFDVKVVNYQLKYVAKEEKNFDAE